MNINPSVGRVLATAPFELYHRQTIRIFDYINVDYHVNLIFPFTFTSALLVDTQIWPRCAIQWQLMNTTFQSTFVRVCVWLKILCNGSKHNMKIRKTIMDLWAWIFLNWGNQLKITFDMICQNHAAVWQIIRI